MPPHAPDRPQLSVLDRLLDADPGSEREVPMTAAETARVFREALRRDLEWLFNTRSLLRPPDLDAPEEETTVLDFGLPDFAALSASSPQTRTQLQRALRHAVETFEPRLSDVEVATVASAGPADAQTLRFLVTGVMLTEPAPESITFDAQLELARGSCRVTGD